MTNLNIMKKIYLFIVIATLFSIKGFSQLAAVDVLDKEINISANDSAEFHFAFTKGDKVAYTLNDINNSGSVEEKIIEYPSTIILKKHKPESNSGMEFKVAKKKIVRFTIYNTGNAELSFRIKINRTPASASTKDFLTNVVWVDKQDTTYKSIKVKGKTIVDTTITGYKTKALVKSEKKENILIDKKLTLNPADTADQSDKAVVLLQLPKNATTKLQSKELVAWAYWIATGKEGEDAYAINETALKDKKSAFQSPIIAFAKGELEELKIPKKGGQIQYYFFNNGKDAELFMANKEFAYIDNGKGVAGYGSGNQLQGNFFIGLKNVSKDKKVDVTIKVADLIESKLYEFRESKIPQTSKTKTGSSTSKQMIIRTIKVPRFAE